MLPEIRLPHRLPRVRTYNHHFRGKTTPTSVMLLFSQQLTRKFVFGEYSWKFSQQTEEFNGVQPKSKIKSNATSKQRRVDGMECQPGKKMVEERFFLKSASLGTPDQLNRPLQLSQNNVTSRALTSLRVVCRGLIF